MKTILLVLCLWAFAYTSVHGDTSENGEVDRVVRSALEYVRSMLKGQHFAVPYEVNDHFRDFVYNMQVKLDRILFGGANDFIVNNVHFNATELSTEVLLEFPSPVITANYYMNGTSFGKKANASGKAQWNMKDFALRGYFQLKTTDGFVSMNKIQFDYSIGNQTFEMQQADLEGWNALQVNAYLHQKSPFFFPLHRVEICQAISEQLLHEINQNLDGVTLPQIIEWLESEIY